MNHQPEAQTVIGMSVPTNEHDRKLAIEELKPQWHGYAELPAMLRALEMKRCGYQAGTQNHCNQPIVRDEFSYSGWRHVHAADWMHWASPLPYDRGDKEVREIFVKCAICGELGMDNEAHLRYDGHKFKAEADRE